LQFQLSNDIVKYFDPHKKEQDCFKETNIMYRYDWKPMESISLEELDLFLTNIVGMAKIEQSPYHIDIIKRNLLHEHSNLRYVCSYTFLDEVHRNQWALPTELDLYCILDERYGKCLEQYHDEVFFNDDIREIWRTAGFCETWAPFVDKYSLIDIYSLDDLYFDDFRSHGGLPKIVRYSLFHLLGKAPIPEETYSEWYMYLQFLIDIGYVKEV
jgi:hypothetical protein